ncbi:hypothetical protein HID58_033363 [Brassica napus]|uniref:Uncharacterized protein n=1 Tax=Brassica napus TaxID=3708 RepID=A0ABQ8BZW5_BRANA|nr:hypothetical protein HID58_033363 [Brassica napus]
MYTDIEYLWAREVKTKPKSGTDKLSLDKQQHRRVHLTLRRTAGASARVPGPEGSLLPFPCFHLCSRSHLSSFARYARVSRMELAETGGSFSREELILVEVVPSPDLRREYSEAERFRVVTALGLVTAGLVVVRCCRSCVPCLFGNGGGCLGFLRVGEILVPIRRYQECSGTVLVLEARLTADVIVVKVSCLIPRGFKTHHNSFGTLIPGVLFSFFSGSLATASLEEFKSLGLNCCIIPLAQGMNQGIGPLVLKGHGCVGGARESFAVSESASRQCSHPGAVVFYGGVADFLAGFRDCFTGCGGGDNPLFCRFR